MQVCQEHQAEVYGGRVIDHKDSVEAQRVRAEGRMRLLQEWNHPCHRCGELAFTTLLYHGEMKGICKACVRSRVAA